MDVAFAVEDAERFGQVLAEVEMLGPLELEPGDFDVLDAVDLPVLDAVAPRGPADQVERVPVMDHAEGV